MKGLLMKQISWDEIPLNQPPTKQQIRKLRAIGIKAKPATREIACCLIAKYQEIIDQTVQ